MKSIIKVTVLILMIITLTGCGNLTNNTEKMIEAKSKNISVDESIIFTDSDVEDVKKHCNELITRKEALKLSVYTHNNEIVDRLSSMRAYDKQIEALRKREEHELAEILDNINLAILNYKIYAKYPDKPIEHKQFYEIGIEHMDKAESLWVEYKK